MAAGPMDLNRIAAGLGHMAAGPVGLEANGPAMQGLLDANFQNPHPPNPILSEHTTETTNTTTNESMLRCMKKGVLKPKKISTKLPPKTFFIPNFSFFFGYSAPRFGALPRVSGPGERYPKHGDQSGNECFK